jgi:photosystem II stability/assembly factor-like uncharacterized protein
MTSGKVDIRRSYGRGLSRTFARHALWAAAWLTLLAPGVNPVAAQGTAVRQHSWEAIGLGGGGAMFTPAISPADPRRILLNCDMSGAYRSDDGGKTWAMIHYQQLTGSTRVRPQWHPTNPNVAFAANGWQGNLKLTRDGGRTWSDVEAAPRPISAIGIDPGRPELMLAAGRRGIARSQDGGKSWKPVDGAVGAVLGFHFDQTSPQQRRTVFAATGRSILRSDNDGASWRDIGAPAGSSRILSFAAGSAQKTRNCILYCAIERSDAGGQPTGGIYRSEDRGTTWSPAADASPAPRAAAGSGAGRSAGPYVLVLTCDASPDRVYASRSEDGRVYRSDDRGASWREVLFQDMKAPEFNVGPNYLIDEPGRGGDVISGFAVNPVDPDHIVVADWMNCFISRDGGQSWTPAHTRSAEVTGRRGKGMRWEHTGLVVTTVWHYYIDPFQPQRHYIAYTDIGYARSTDAGKTWYWHTGRPLRNTTYELAFDPDTPGKIWAACADLHDIPNENVISGRHYFAGASGGIGLSTDFGVSWQDSSQGLARKPITSVVVDPRSPRTGRTLYASAFEDGVYKSTDGGQMWQKASDGLGAPGINERACRIRLHPDGTLFCLVTALRRNGSYVAEGPGLYRSTDAAKTWTWINRSQPLKWPKDFDVDPRDSRIVYVGAADAAGADGGLYKTTDGGASWSRIAGKGGDCFGATVNPGKPDWVYMCIPEGGDEPGLWLSKDAGKSWKPLEGMPFRNAQRVTFDPSDDSLIYVSTFGGSVWRGPAQE